MRSFGNLVADLRLDIKWVGIVLVQTKDFRGHYARLDCSRLPRASVQVDLSEAIVVRAQLKIGVSKMVSRGCRGAALALDEADLHKVKTVGTALDVKAKPIPAMRFKIFEQKSYRDSERINRINVEPRELKVADVTGDGKDDLVTVIHDRIIIYPQD